MQDPVVYTLVEGNTYSNDIMFLRCIRIRHLYDVHRPTYTYTMFL